MNGHRQWNADPRVRSVADEHAHKVRMIRKLRWIGSEDEARQLELELRSVRGSDSVLAAPRDTD